MTVNAGRIVFACGAAFEGVREFPRTNHEKADGRIRLAVYDSDDLDEKNCGRPRIGASADAPRTGEPAPCRFGCPAKRAGNREENRCFPDLSDDEIKQRKAAGSRLGYGDLAWRTLITCYGRIEGLEQK